MRFGKSAGYGALMGAILALAACETRSISDSGYGGGNNRLYRGELSEYQVLGIDKTSGFSEADIQKAMVQKQPIAMPKGSAVMLVQSGALLADPDMVAAMEKYYTVSSFSGVPMDDSGRFQTTQAPTVPYSQLFRMAAARGGYETIVVYWGVLESAKEGLGGKGISWLPVIGGIVPDQTQHMRIRLMIAAIDVRSGQWESLSPEPVDDEAMSNEHGREASDQRQVALLKAKAYKAAAEEIALRYSR